MKLFKLAAIAELHHRPAFRLQQQSQQLSIGQFWQPLACRLGNQVPFAACYQKSGLILGLRVCKSGEERLCFAGSSRVHLQLGKPAV